MKFLMSPRVAMAGVVLAIMAATPSCAQPLPNGAPQVFVYAVQNGRASDIALSLANLYGGSAPEGGTVSTTSAAPTAGMSPTEARAYASIMSSTTTPAASAAPTASLPRDDPSNARFTVPAASFGGSGTISISADDANNVLDILATPEEHAALQAALQRLDIEPLQVFLEMAIVEVTLTNNLNYGLQYFFQPGSGQNQIVLSNSTSTAIPATLPGFAYSFTHGTDIQVVLSALAAKTNVKVISAPKLLVMNMQTATLVAGARVPFATEQAIDIVTSSPAITNKIDYRDTGVVMKVTPRIAHGTYLTLDVSENVSQPTPTTTSKIDSPTFQQRSIDSRVAVKDGDTVALGGLIADEDVDGDTGIPYLKDIPVLGKLFGTTGDTRTRTELLVMITPHVVHNAAEAQAVTNYVQGNVPAPAPLLAAPH